MSTHSITLATAATSSLKVMEPVSIAPRQLLTDPTILTNYHATDDELLEFWFLCVLLRGRNSDRAFQVLSKFLDGSREYESIDHYIRRLYSESKLIDQLKVAEIDGFKRVGAAFLQSLNVNLRTATVDELMELPEVDNRCVRFFLIHTRMNFRGAVLDSFVMRWMRRYVEDCPIKPPTSYKMYAKWEEKALELFDTYFPSLTMAEIDAMISLMMSNRVREGFQ